MLQTRPGLPEGWNERVKETFSQPPLPDGVEFYATPGHGYLRVDLTKQTAKVSSYDYQIGHIVLLEEDCSMPMWLAEHGLIAMTESIRNQVNTIPREDASWERR